MGDEEMIIEMIEVFLEGYNDALSEMQELHKEEDWEKLRARAHKFKPNLAYMGISIGMEKIEELEKRAKNNNAELMINSNLKKLQNICDQASVELRKELESMNLL